MEKHLLLSAVPMAGQDFEAKYVDSHDILKTLAAEGVEFLLSCEGKVAKFLKNPPSLLCVYVD